MTTKTKACMGIAAGLLALGTGGLIAVQWPEIRREFKIMRMS